jgi:hypothetical protein
MPKYKSIKRMGVYKTVADCNISGGKQKLIVEIKTNRYMSANFCGRLKITSYCALPHRPYRTGEFCPEVGRTRVTCFAIRICVGFLQCRSVSSGALLEGKSIFRRKVDVRKCTLNANRFYGLIGGSGVSDYWWNAQNCGWNPGNSASV